MEGSRHERVLLVLTAYIIGFTTAFIAYALPAKHQVTPQVFSIQTNEQDDVSVPQTAIYLDETGLYVSSPQTTQLLSVNQASPLMANAVFGAPTSGVHYRLIDAELSRDRDFVYFCEQLTETAQTCDPYVFSIQDGILHEVTVNDVVYPSSVANHTSSWSSDGKLQLDGYISASSETPWELVAQ